MRKTAYNVSMNKFAIEVSNLKKSYGKLEVLKGVSFNVPTGSIMALLGPNGAGKTTTVKVLSTLLRPDSGKAFVNGHNAVTSGHKVRGEIGLTGQFAAVDEYLTGRENIEMIGKLYHMKKDTITPRAQELLEKFDLTEAGDRAAKTYSGGMKRRLDLAMSLVASPSVLFLDEPTTGLDPRSRLGLWEMIKDLAKNGTTILLTTQYMEEADYLANNIMVIDHGVVIAEGTSAQLKAKAGSDKVVVTFKTEADFKKAHKIISGTADAENYQLSLPAKNGVDSLQEALAKLKKSGITPDTASLSRPTLDDVFLALTGHSAEEPKVEHAKKGAK